MLVEFAGISGSGKSTLLNAVQADLRRNGIKCRNFYKFCSNAGFKHETNWRKALTDEEKSSAHELISLWEFCAKKPLLSQVLFESALFAQAQMLDLTQLLFKLVQYQKIGSHECAVFLDEGLLYRGVAGFSAQNNMKDFQVFLKEAILPEVFVHNKVDPKIANERALSRLSPRKRRQAKSQEGKLTLHQLQTKMLELVCEEVRKRNSIVIEVDGRNTVNENATIISSVLRNEMLGCRQSRAFVA